MPEIERWKLERIYRTPPSKSLISDFSLYNLWDNIPHKITTIKCLAAVVKYDIVEYELRRKIYILQLQSVVKNLSVKRK